MQGWGAVAVKGNCFYGPVLGSCLAGGAQADALVDRLVHGAVRIDLGDVNIRKLLSEKK